MSNPPSSALPAAPVTRAALMAYLSGLGIKTTTVDHKAVFTVAESLELEKGIPGGHTKNLFLKDKKGALYLVVALNDAAIDLKTLHKRIGAQRLSFGNAELLLEVLGVIPGAVTPFALVNDRTGRVTVILDHLMMQHAILNYHPLDNSATTSIRGDDLLTYIRSTGHEPRIMDVRAETAASDGEG